MKALNLIFLWVMAVVAPALAGNPLFPGWYADPEGVIIGDEYWIFPTYSAPYDQQLHFDAFSSKDLVTWTQHERIISHQEISWLRRALWAPAIVQKDGKFYLFFGANDVHEGETNANHRVTCMDRMYFDEQGFIKPIKITHEGVEKRTLGPAGN